SSTTRMVRLFTAPPVTRNSCKSPAFRAPISAASPGNCSRFFWNRGLTAGGTPCRTSGIARHSKWYSDCPYLRRWTLMSNNEVISILERLIQTCNRGREGFRNAAESIQNSEFRRLFNIFAQQRGQFITELKAEAHRLSGDGNIEAEGMTEPSG